MAELQRFEPPPPPPNPATLDDVVKELRKIKGDDDDSVEVHQKALDDLVNVNSLFTIAVFVGLSFATPNVQSLDSRSECNADPNMAKRLILYEVNSFACFLFSSLVAKAVKVVLNIKKKFGKKGKGHLKVPDYVCVPDTLCVNVLLSDTWRRSLLTLSIVASFAGIVLLTLSMVNVIQIRVGKLSCGSEYAFDAVVSMCVIVFAALLLYAPSMVYAVIVTSDLTKQQNSDQVSSKNKDGVSSLLEV